MKTLADLKRDAAAGKIKLELLERYGETGENLPPHCRGVRQVDKVNTVAITLITADGLKSELRFDSAKLVEYTGEFLTIYERGERDLTEQEQKILDEWQRIEKEYTEQNPFCETYWKKKQYFDNCPCPYLAGYDSVNGKRYRAYNQKVIDNQIRGNAILKYKVYQQ
jgi:hypothetical protein